MRSATLLIETLGLAPHPEGGHFREVFRSPDFVQPADGRGARAGLTTIFFLLAGGEVSRWHRVASDEVWHLYEGDPLELLTMSPDLSESLRQVLGPVGNGSSPVHVVPAGHWQSARSTGAYTLAGCTVGPGFDFADFALLRERRTEAEALRKRYPELEGFL